nr:MAG TPA: hypothetical protein [Caudoviricetes sp.]
MVPFYSPRTRGTRHRRKHLDGLQALPQTV